MRRILLSLLAVVVISGLFTAVGYAGYRFGYAHGAQSAQSTANGDDIPRPGLRPFDNFGSRGLPDRSFGFDREFRRGFGIRGFPMMGFGFFSLFRFLVQIAVLGLIVWFVYWLFTHSGYRITRTVQTTAPQAPPTDTEAKE
jgi:hypothetical protein